MTNNGMEDVEQVSLISLKRHIKGVVDGDYDTMLLTQLQFGVM